MSRCIIFFFFCGLSYCSMAQTLYVDSSAVLGGNGGSWATAFNELSDALDSAWHNPAIEEVHVAKGTYHPSHRPYNMNTSRVGVEFFGGPDENVTFHVRTGLEMLGGFPNGGGVRAPSLNETSLDGILPNGDTVYRVCYLDSSVNWATSNDTTILDGFSIINGSARDYSKFSLVNGLPFTLSTAGGVSVYSGQFIIANNTITNNNSGISVEGATGIIINNTIKHNDTLMGRGNNFGGIGLHACKVVTIENNLISDNSGISYGGIGGEGVNGSVIVKGNTFKNNYGQFNGGGYFPSSFIIFKNNIVDGNSANGIGGFGLSSGSIIGNLFRNNTGNIGAAQIQGYSVFSNNVLVNNTGVEAGGVYTFFGDSLFVANNTFISNSNFAIRICCESSSFSNNIFYDNGKDFEWQSSVDTNEYIFRNNLLEDDSLQYNVANYKPLDSLDVDNLYNLNPIFVDINDPFGPDNIFGTADDGLHLAGNSACIDAGNNSLIPMNLTTDVTGSPRIENGLVNMGAYESRAWPTAIEEAKEAGLGVYPNPVKSQLNIKIVESGKIVITDVLGSSIAKYEVAKGETKLDVSDFAKGTYFLQLKGGNKTWNTKFIKH